MPIDRILFGSPRGKHAVGPRHAAHRPAWKVARNRIGGVMAAAAVAGIFVPAPDAQADQPTAATACWVEKVHSAATAEVICGNPALRPRTDTADIGQVFADRRGGAAVVIDSADCGWVATSSADGFDIAPAGCN